jgi:hypothetical protein
VYLLPGKAVKHGDKSHVSVNVSVNANTLINGVQNEQMAMQLSPYQNLSSRTNSSTPTNLGATILGAQSRVPGSVHAATKKNAHKSPGAWAAVQALPLHTDDTTHSKEMTNLASRVMETSLVPSASASNTLLSLTTTSYSAAAKPAHASSVHEMRWGDSKYLDADANGNAHTQHIQQSERARERARERCTHI